MDESAGEVICCGGARSWDFAQGGDSDGEGARDADGGESGAEKRGDEAPGTGEGAAIQAIGQAQKIRLPANGWRPRDYQIDAWEYLQADGKHCELIWHRRSGKDELSLHWSAVSGFRRVGNYWHMLPLANQARKALWTAVNPHTGKKRIDEAFPRELRAGENDTEMFIKLKSGSTWQVVGSDNFSSLVGSPPVGLVFSEWALCDPAAWAYLMPILEENGGWAIFNSTPRGKNHAYRSLNGAKKNPASFGQLLDATQTSVFSAAQLAGIRASLIETYGEEYGLSVFEQEYMCSFEAANLGAILGRALVRAEREGRIDDIHDYDSAGAPIEISSDIGRRDASSWFFWQPCLGGFRIVDFMKDSGRDADEWAIALNERCQDRGYTLGHIWLPVDAKAKTFSAKHTAVEIFLQHFGAARMRMTPAVEREDRINAARRVIRRCSFHRTKTEKGRDGLSAWCYEYDEERREFSKEPRHDFASHDGDAFSYGAIVMEEEQPAPKEEKPRTLEVGDNTIFGGATLNELWRDHDNSLQRVQRI